MKTLYNHALEPNGPSCMDNGWVDAGAYSAGSLHNGAVNVLFADGHASPVRDRIASAVWQALDTRDGGEAVSDDRY